MLAKLRQLAGDELRQRARRAPLADDTVLYEAFHGIGMLCNPEAIFRAALAAPDLGHLRHVWALTDPASADVSADPRVRVVRRGSLAYYRTLATAKYLINNATFPAAFAKRDGQLYLNTWHGTPIKAMGYDVPGGAYPARNVVRNLVAADYLLAPNDETARMYLDAYRARNLFAGKLIRTGTPRIDHQFNAGTDVRRRLHIDADTPLLLYAPTWRGDFDRPDNDVAELRAVVTHLTAHRPGYAVRLKVHQQAYEHARDDPQLRGLLVPNAVPTNELLACTDVLVTDYSSIWVDFLATGRPIVYYAPDLAEYTERRGFNLPPDEWPGPIARTLDELVAALDTHTMPDPALRERYCPREDGGAAQRVVDVVFRGRTSADVVPAPSDGRTPLLVHVGNLTTSGITTAGLSLLTNIDHERFDVSAFFAETPGTDGHWRDLLDPRVRLFVQPAGLTGAKVRVRPLVASARGPRRSARRLARAYPRMLRAEWTKAFAASRFAHIVDFSGYDPYWTKLLAARPSGSFSVWLHNEIAAEMTNRERPARLRARLRGMVALYQTADHLVSVSPALCSVNRRELAAWAPAERFTYARNTIDATRVLQSADTDFAKTGTTFVTVGRLSPAKNQLRLITAFRQVLDAEPAARLVIVGDGPQRDELTAAVAELGLGAAVTLAGHQPNPYPAMAAADCFVLSSDYEGQPMVLLEALVLGLPIITTRFDTVAEALPAGCGLVVDRDATALADGMLRFLRGDVAPPSFDAAGYNREAMAEFYRAIGAVSTAG